MRLFRRRGHACGIPLKTLRTRLRHLSEAEGVALVAFGPAKEGTDIRARHRATQPARDGFAFLDPANALLDGGGMGGSICRGRSAPADSAFDAGDELLLSVD